MRCEDIGQYNVETLANAMVKHVQKGSICLQDSSSAGFIATHDGFVLQGLVSISG